MFCSKCGAQMDETATVCPNCGTPCDSAESPMQQTVQAEKRRGGGLKIALSLVLVAALVGGCFWFLKNHTRKSNKLEQAASRSFTLLGDYLGELPNLNSIQKNLDTAIRNGVFSYNIEANESLIYDDDDDWNENYHMQYGIDMDVNAGKAHYSTDLSTVMGTWDTSSGPMPLDLYFNKEKISITGAFLKEGEAIVLPVQDFTKQFNESTLAKLMEIELPNLDLMNIKTTEQGVQEWEEHLTKFYGEDWTKFENSVEWVKYEENGIFGSSGDTYVLNWDADLLNAMLRKTDLKKEMQNMFSGNMDPEQLAELCTPEFTAKTVVFALGNVANYVRNPLAYVEDGVLKGCSLEIAVPDNEMRVIFQLLGTQNPWEHLTVEVQRKSGESYSTLGNLDLTMTKASGKLHLNATVMASGQPFASVVLSYDDSNGSFVLEEVNGEPIEQEAEVTLVPTEKGLQFRLKTEVDDGFRTRNVEFVFGLSDEVSNLDAPQITKKIEILKLTEEELEELGEQIEAKLNKMSGYVPGYDTSEYFTVPDEATDDLDESEEAEATSEASEEN